MTCRNCGAEIGEVKFCPRCGAPQTEEAEHIRTEMAAEAVPGAGGVSELYRGIFKDPMFTAVTILITIAAVLSSFSYDSTTGSVSVSFGILTILYAIALWLIFAAARNSEKFSGTGLAMASGVVKASFIIIWVAIVFMLLAGAAFMIGGPQIMNSLPLDDLFASGAISISGLPEGSDLSIYGILPSEINIGVLTTIAAVVVLIAAVIFVIVNIFFFRNLHKFTKSVCVSLAEDSLDIKKANTSRLWLLVLGIINAVGFVLSAIGVSDIGSVLPTIASGCNVAATILASVMIKKHFC